METKTDHPDVDSNLQLALFKSLLIPVLVLAFFVGAPYWLNSKLRAEITDAVGKNASFSPEEKSVRAGRIAVMDFRRICLDCPPGMEKQHDNLKQAGVVRNFQCLRWGLRLSLALVGGLGIALCVIAALNNKAKQGRDWLIRGYRLSWKISMVAALAKVFLLIPLLAYGVFEFTVLLANHFYPSVLLAIVLGGIFALWRSAAILMKNIPMEFSEPMASELTPAEAPELWRTVRAAAERLQTTPPDRILTGLQLNCYVTELAVNYGAGRAEGRTLYISYPILRHLSEEEALAVIGHELGHFIGEDTRMTREFYPLRLKARATMIAMASSGWIGWPSFQFLNYFNWRFAKTEQAASRVRELLADQKAAALTTPEIAASALVRFQVSAEAFQRSLKEAIGNRAQNPLDVPLQTILEEQLVPDTAFWTKLFEKKLPHPLDSHPSLRVRLQALGQTFSVDQAREIALKKTDSAYNKWFSNRQALFADLTKRAEQAVGKMRARTQLLETDYATESGKRLLDAHFPEKRWREKPSRFWAGIVLLGIPGLLCIVGLIAIDDTTARIVMGLLELLVGLGVTAVFIRRRRTELILNADGLIYTGWTRPLRFHEVDRISARRVYSDTTLTFHLKTKQPPLGKFRIVRFPVKTATISIGGFEEKPATTVETIFKYFTRQAGQPSPAAQA